MFVLSYFEQDIDQSTIEIIAVSSSKELLEQKKEELLGPSRTYRKAYEEFRDKSKNKIREFCERNRLDLRAKHRYNPAYQGFGDIQGAKFTKHYEDEVIETLVCQYYLFDGKHEESLFGYNLDKDKLTESLPVFAPPNAPGKVYCEESWGGQGLTITEVEEIKPFVQ